MSEQDAVSADAKAMMQFQARRKSVGIAYLLWFFLGSLGIHRFYAGQTGTGVAMLVLFVLSTILLVVGVGLVGLFVLGIWLFVDIFLIPGMVERYNGDLLSSVS
ncbi:TM2 domain-containing protein [Kordiimonas marina]|uniref:TM2 domain-containing protein n=1 Tax=Kordiimonas marina TaxID=2872312 RepID=UPI001FF5E1BD|nr:TM2 domain-containing protein [Kordiimonas marina]MCJ9427845.1 TM2 domain-containing protein [Kordiimonas marina]